MKIKGNTSAHWADCVCCGLRLGYWPANGLTGRYRQNENPDVVQKALETMKADGLWDKSSEITVKAYIKKIEAELRTAKATTNARSARRYSSPSKNSRPGLRRTPTSPTVTSNGSWEDVEMDAAQLREQIEELKRERKSLLKEKGADTDKDPEQAQPVSEGPAPAAQK